MAGARQNPYSFATWYLANTRACGAQNNGYFPIHLATSSITHAAREYQRVSRQQPGILYSEHNQQQKSTTTQAQSLTNEHKPNLFGSPPESSNSHQKRHALPQSKYIPPKIIGERKQILDQIRARQGAFLGSYDSIKKVDPDNPLIEWRLDLKAEKMTQVQREISQGNVINEIIIDETWLAELTPEMLRRHANFFMKQDSGNQHPQTPSINQQLPIASGYPQQQNVSFEQVQRVFNAGKSCTIAAQAALQSSPECQDQGSVQLSTEARNSFLAEIQQVDHRVSELLCYLNNHEPQVRAFAENKLLELGDLIINARNDFTQNCLQNNGESNHGDYDLVVNLLDHNLRIIKAKLMTMVNNPPPQQKPNL